MPTVTVEADIEISDIDNCDLMEELRRRLQQKKFDRQEQILIHRIVSGNIEAVTLMDKLLSDELEEAKKKYSILQIIDKLK